MNFVGISSRTMAVALIAFGGQFAYHPTVQATPQNSPSSNFVNVQDIPVTRTQFGVNVATWDYQMLDPSTISSIQTLGTGIQQFPNDGDLWNWKTDVSRSSNSPNSQWDNFKEPVSLDKWGEILRETGNQGLYIVDYGTNSTWTGGATPADAKAVTQYIVQNNLPITSMVIGSEAYGNWRANLHKNKTPQEYALVAKEMAIAIHSVDPSMKVGIDLVCPSPQGNSPQDLYWNQTVLQEDAPYIQFVSLHSYLSNQLLSDSGLLQYLSVIPTIMSEVHAEMTQVAPKYADHIQTWITELNPYAMGTPAQSITPVYGAALAESVLLFRACGATQVDWWSLHGGAHPVLPNGQLSSEVDNTPGTPYGTNGLLADGMGPEPATNTPYPAALAYAQIMQAVQNGAELDVHLGSTWFVARIANQQSSSTWFIINNSNLTQTYTLDGTEFVVPSASMKSISLSQAAWPYSGTGTAAAATVTSQVYSGVPQISSVNPCVSPGETVTVIGSGFGEQQGSGYLQLQDGTTSWGAPGNDATFNVLSWSPNKITFVAPFAQGAWSLIPGTEASIQIVSDNLGVSNIMNTEVSGPEKPVVTSTSVNNISPGEMVTVNGSGFGDIQSGGYVHLEDDGVNWGMVGNQAVFHIVSWSDTQIQFVAPVPSGPGEAYKLVPGTEAQITVTNGAGQTSNSLITLVSDN